MMNREPKTEDEGGLHGTKQLRPMIGSNWTTFEESPVSLTLVTDGPEQSSAIVQHFFLPNILHQEAILAAAHTVPHKSWSAGENREVAHENFCCSSFRFSTAKTPFRTRNRTDSKVKTVQHGAILIKEIELQQ